MKYRVLNNRAQPVELHLGSGVVVIPALGETELDLDEAGDRHLEHMASQLRVTVLPCPAGDRTAKETAEAKRKGAKRTAAKRNAPASRG